MSIVPSPYHVRIGLDESGNSEKSLVGWTAFCLDAVNMRALAQEAEEIRRATGLSAFHGSEFTPNSEAQYREFLRAVRHRVQASPNGFVRADLISRPYYRANGRQAFKLVAGAMGLGGEHRAPIVRQMQAAFGRVVWIATTLGALLRSVTEFRLELSASSDHGLLDQAARFGSDTQPQTVWIARLYNGFVNTQRGGHGPRLMDVTVADPSESVLVQGADVIANFAMAHLRVLLLPGPHGKRTVLKSRICEEEIDLDRNSRRAGLGPLQVVNGRMRVPPACILHINLVEVDKPQPREPLLPTGNAGGAMDSP